jgi:toxin ParE1/3/4
VKVDITDLAEDDLESIGDWIAKDNPERAASFIVELRQSCLNIGPWPLAFPLLAHRQRDDIRRKVHGNYLILYRVRRDAIETLRILHGARDYAQIVFNDDDLD